MELAFLNGILRSESFPPLDPWLSGYGISYYYFGYVMIALLTTLTGAATSVAFNLANALWFALVAAGSYSILYNLLAARSKHKPSLAAPLLAPLFVLIAGNLEGFLDVLHSQQLFWQTLPTGETVSQFWQWLDIKQLTDPPLADATWIPQRHLWWWRASRVVNDVNLAGNQIEVIDEFPFFSFLLADNHPHLLAIPFALMAVAFSLQIFMAGERGEQRMRESSLSRSQLVRGAWIVAGLAVGLILVRAVVAVTGSEALSILEAIQRASVELLLAGLGLALVGILVLVLLGALPIALRREEFAFAAWLFGGLAFLNIWDFPIYIGLLIGALALNSLKESFGEWGPRLLYTGAAVGAAAVLLYLPWYPTFFPTQAGGILSNLIFPTRLQQFVVMFGVALLPILVWMLWRIFGRAGRPKRLWLILVVGLGTPLAWLFASILIGTANYGVLTRDPLQLEAVLRGLGVAGASLQDGVDTVLAAASQRRAALSFTAIALGLIVGAGFWLLISDEGNETGQPETWPFVVLLIGIGALLVLTPEFVYLRDLFGTRMNTVFKFYFAAWILWGIAAAYACVELWPKRWSQAWRLVIYVPVLLGLVYPVLATWTKANGFDPVFGRTLDGTAYLENTRPADYEAINWINEALPNGTIAEAIGGSYSEYARVSTHTGLPTVLGWGGHEVQWRGNAASQGSRQADIQRLYETTSWTEALELLDKYGIDYVYVGPLEAQTYLRLSEGKFETFMEKVYENGEVRIYSRGIAG